MQSAVIALLLAARHDLHTRERRTRVGQDRTGLLSKRLEIRELVYVLVSSRAGETREAYGATAWDRMTAVRFLGAVLHDEVIEILGSGFGRRDQCAEVHQQAAVAVEHDHAAVWPAEC